MNGIKYGFRLIFITLSITSSYAFAADATNKEATQPGSQQHTSSQVPLAEKNQLQETPQDNGSDKEIAKAVTAPQTNEQPQQAEAETASKEKQEMEEKEYEPAFTNSAWEQFDVPDSFYDDPYRISLFSPENGEDGERLWSQTTSIFYYGLGAVAILAVMPEEITNWEDAGDVNLAKKWFDNVTAGPVWDRDDAFLNYIMHPYFGGVYYQSARKSGYRQWDSFMYGVVMSTFFWEYGVEAFAEIPSMQDLVVTPVLGWVYGEWAFNKEREIWADGGTVWGSEYLGNTALFLLDPVDSMGRNVNRLFGRDLIKAGTGYIKLSEQDSPYGGESDKQVLFQVNYTFGEDDSKALPGISGKRKLGEYYSFGNSNDPVDYGIVGMTLGSGYINYANKRELINQYYAQVSLGLYFTPKWSARLNYSSTKMMKEIVKPDYTYESFSVDGQYYFNSEENFRPYISAGVGEEIWNEDKDRYNFQLNAGLGVHYKLTDNWALQAEVINYHTFKTHSNEQQATAKILYRFGKGEHANSVK